MINYIEKGYGLHKYLADLQYYLEEQDGVWICNKPDEEVNALIASYNPWPSEKAAKLVEINEWLENQIELVLKDIPKVEQNSWHKQVSEARGLQPLSMLLGIAARRGITVDLLIDKVLEKEKAFSDYYSLMQGERDRVETLVKAFPDEGSYELLPDLWALSCTV